MATVHFTSRQRSLTGGVAEVEVEATIVKELIDKLEEMFPGLGAHLDETSATAVAINGNITPDAIFEPVPEGAEIHFLQPLPGG
jgi:molybdopterin synthase sulfur carrier subunit